MAGGQPGAEGTQSVLELGRLDDVEVEVGQPAGGPVQVVGAELELALVAGSGADRRTPSGWTSSIRSTAYTRHSAARRGDPASSPRPRPARRQDHAALRTVTRNSSLITHRKVLDGVINEYRRVA